MIGTETQGWRKGRYTMHAIRVMDFLPGVDHRTWALQAQDRDWWKATIRKADAHHKPDKQGDPLKCPLCAFTSSTANGVTHHINSVHAVGKLDVFKCVHCDKAYKRAWALKEHERKEHGAGHPVAEPKPKDHKCKYCEKGFALVSTRNHHEKRDCLARPGSGAVQFGGRWVLLCPKCPKAVAKKNPFGSTRGLALHDRQAHGRPP